MMKADEIKLLDKTIRAFGTESYLGPWLAENRASFVADITNDVTPDPTMPAQARREAFDLLAAAKAEAAEIVSKGRQEAVRLVDQARQESWEVRHSAAKQLERAAAVLDGRA
jgi:cell division septum initiation protein DivIVA